ncbi:MAG: HPr(Ser) kinase/phosphatase [Gemmatimonadetes bacterium]|nr:HPr(Ser) kinase/phosphatase [Gemmatimonadota bacterium]
MNHLTIEELFRSKRDSLQLELLTPDSDLGREVRSSTVSSPGLVLAGFTDRYPTGRLQVLGETEISFLQSLGADTLHSTLAAFLALDPPALFITLHLEPPTLLVQLAAERGIPVLQSQLKTSELYRRLQPYLEDRFAPTTTLHGSLADVYGVGLLFVGRSGIGKSECVLDLVERGHRLVAADVVIITRRGLDVLIGRGHELQMHHMEIRGIGIVDIRTLFGIRAIRQQKRLEVVVQLVDWDPNVQYERTGLETEEVDILGVKLPKVLIPLNAGKNITVISEVVAMNHLLKYSGVHSARLFNDRLREAMRPVRDYLEEDYE